MIDNQKILRTAWLIEIQAISIYESEIWFYRWSSWTEKRKITLKLFHEILLEELHHKQSIDDWLKVDWQVKFLAPIYRYSGFLIGCLIAFLPSKLSWYFHTNAEKQAAKNYQLALDQLNDPSFSLTQILVKSIQQEKEHAKKYQALAVLF